MQATVLKKIIVLLCVFHRAIIPAQSNITGTVMDANREVLPYATVALLNAKDSLPVKGINTDDKGVYIFESIQPGNYLIKAVNVGFKDGYGAVFTLDSSAHYKHPELLMQSKENNLDEISVVAQKKTFEFKNGNITVNIENSPLAIGNSVYDVLTRMPGITIQNNSISLQGKEGVSIYIDDRIQQLSGPQLIALLKGMNASNVEKIEIIKNPSAKYDAAGSAGIINIKTKKLKITGFNGSAGYTFSQGHYGTHLGDFSLNYKGTKFAVFSNVSLYKGLLKNTLSTSKTISYDSATTRLNSSQSDVDNGTYGNTTLGLDCFLNKRTTLGIKYQGLFGNVLRTKEGNTALSDNDLGYTNLLYKRTQPNNFYAANYNFNIEHNFDTLGTKLKFSTDVYAPNYDIFKTDYDYRFTDLQQKEVLAPRYDKSYNRLDLAIVSGRLDFEKKISKTLNLETGLKASDLIVKSDYVFQHQDPQTGVFKDDSLLTNNFEYHEQISAAYINLQKDIKKINFQMGLRAENTNVKTLSELNAYKYSIHYLKLFPTLTINYNRSDAHNFSLSFNRRISRPDYNSFNPYPSFNNLFSLSRGNPHLLPEISNNIDISHTFKGKFSNSFSYSRMQNPIRAQSLQIDSTKLTINQQGNLNYSNEMRYYLYLNTDIKKWWMLTCGLGAFYFDFTGTIGGLPLKDHGYSYYGYMNHQITLPKNIKLEVSGFYVGPWLAGGLYIYSPRGALNLGLKKNFLDDKLNVSIGLTDLFFTNVARATVNFQNQHSGFRETYDTRRLNINLTYNFGKLKFLQRDIKSDETARLKK